MGCMGKAAVIKTNLKGWVNLSKPLSKLWEKKPDSSQMLISVFGVGLNGLDSALISLITNPQEGLCPLSLDFNPRCKLSIRR